MMYNQEFHNHHMAMKVLKRSKVAPLENTAAKPQTNMKVYRNMLKMLLVVVALYMTCWTLMSVVFMVLNFGLISNKQKYSRSLYNVCMFMVFANCVVNPFIYAAKYRQFQNGVRKLVGWKVGVTVTANRTTGSIMQQQTSTNRTTGSINQQQMSTNRTTGS